MNDISASTGPERCWINLSTKAFEIKVKQIVLEELGSCALIKHPNHCYGERVCLWYRTGLRSVLSQVQITTIAKGFYLSGNPVNPRPRSK